MIQDNTNNSQGEHPSTNFQFGTSRNIISHPEQDGAPKRLCLYMSVGSMGLHPVLGWVEKMSEPRNLPQVNKHPLSSCLGLPRVPKFCLMTMIKIWRFQSHEGRSFKPLDHDVVLKLRLGIHHFQKSMKLFYIILYTVFFAIKNY